MLNYVRFTGKRRRGIITKKKDTSKRHRHRDEKRCNCVEEATLSPSVSISKISGLFFVFLQAEKRKKEVHRQLTEKFQYRYEMYFV